MFHRVVRLACYALGLKLTYDSDPLLRPKTVSTARPVAQLVPFDVISPFGVRSDPYYWLRDDLRSDPTVLQYLEAENAYCDAALAPLAGPKDKLYQELIGRLAPEDSSVPYHYLGHWYYTRYAKGHEYPLYARYRDQTDAPEEILLDAEAEACGADFYEVGALAVSPDSRLVVYAEDRLGRRQYILRVKDIANARLLPDTIQNVEADIAWASDNQTFLYVAKDPDTLLGCRLMCHRVGTECSQDILLYTESDSAFYMHVKRSKSGRFIYLILTSTIASEVRYARSDDPGLQFDIAIPRTNNHEYQLDDLDDRFVILTNEDAENFRIISAPILQIADRSAWREEIPHLSNTFIEEFELFKGFLVISERHGGLSRLRVHNWKSGVSSLISADEPTYTMTIGVNEDHDSVWLRYGYASPATPRTTYDYNLQTGERIFKKREPVWGSFDSTQYQTELLMVDSRDGVQIPVSVLYRRDTLLNGTAPLHLYAYGAYGLSQDPGFRSTVFSLVDRGFVYAIAHVRGGQEWGRRWYDQGRLLNKRNTFNDFIDATQFLVKAGYGDARRVCATGGSAGGLLIGVIANQAPQLYCALVAQVPFVDILTTMLDESIPLTTNEYDEWGEPGADAATYAYMSSYSPYDNVQTQAYPAIYVATGLHDSQVQYWEPAKWVARLAAIKTDNRPLLLRTNMDAGHGGTSGRFKRYRDIAEEMIFLLDQMGLVGDLTTKGD